MNNLNIRRFEYLSDAVNTLYYDSAVKLGNRVVIDTDIRYSSL